MKKLILLAILVTISSFSYINMFSDQIKVISYNVRYNNPNDGKDIWKNRKSTIVEFIKTEIPDFIGLQEVTNSQLLYLNSNLLDYHYIGVGRDDGKTKGEYSPIFYNKSNYELIKSDTFWLSDTPKHISVGWDASMERICTYGLFKQNISGRKVWVFNTHFDHIGNIAREKSVDLILKKINDLTEINDYIIITGDFNLPDNSNPIKKIQKFYSDVSLNMDKLSNLYGTFNNFQIRSNSKNRIDYIFYKKFILIESNHGNVKTKQGRWASDHHPVISLFNFL
tara:strand:+ start:180 stop:1022 length:843 start_codon:yes stop_codon:yes gene_type:complete